MGDKRSVWRGIDDALFQFTTTQSSEIHLALMTVFEQASVLMASLNIDTIRAELIAIGWDEPLADETLTRSLDALTGWGLLDATQDHAANYATPEEFERKNMQWSLTRRGEAAMAGVLRSLEVLTSAVGLQSATLDAIGDALADLVAMLATTGPDTNGRMHIRLAELEGHHRSLIESVRQFNGHLHRLIRADVTDDELFADIKRRTIGYLQEYVDGVERPQHRIALRLLEVESADTAALFGRALDGANLAPLAAEDPGPAWIAEREHHWRALRIWFAPEDAARPQIQRLVEVARSAIIELLRAIERRFDNRSRSTTVASDFRRLAQLFDDCPGDDEAHILFSAAFGMWPARHAHKAAADGTQTRTSTSWLEAEPTDVEPALRTRGNLSERGRTARVRDPKAVRELRRRQHQQHLTDQRALQESLTTNGTVRLSSIAALANSANRNGTISTDMPVGQFGELLHLLASALMAPPGLDQCRRSTSTDGAIEISLEPAHDDEMTTITTSAGTFTSPDFIVSIHLTQSAASTTSISSYG